MLFSAMPDSEFYPMRVSFDQLIAEEGLLGCIYI